ncbi:glycosyltransferase family 2 protein [Pseudocolwellia agarivorans]|uniref:glycosyltransferase family 2 protein n=1 Tax=Pseudocolwellia agarivorans TaxID=1911682 RepID=UPI00098466C2|nr:glycosyltransferase family 2 protein [Pseudocolwellia agarivorans]
MYKGHKVCVVIPALNEEQAIDIVVRALVGLKLDKQAVIDHVVVCDNGSTDNTENAAAAAGAQVVKQNTPGYGIACLTAMAHLPLCDIVLFVDGDDSCIISQAIPLLEGISRGADLTIGSRTLGKIEVGALTGPQVFGNWLSSYLITLFWGQKITDLGPFRAIRYSSLKSLQMADKTFGWTVEMQVKAIIHGMDVREYPVDSKVRIGESKISGTVSGSVKAGIGILSMIGKLYLSQSKLKKTLQDKTV